jgi:RNA polymerase sigma-70 factor (ECF subfamily)
MESDRLGRVGREEVEDSVQDDRDALGLLFACAHPALDTEAQVALTLRWAAGLETPAIAKAFLVTEDTMTRRLTRAKTKVRESGIPLKVPEEPWREDRLAAVLGVLYLLFNQGNDADPGDSDRFTLAGEALRLAEDLARRLGPPDDAEAWGLVALIRFTLGRRPGRFNLEGGLVTLDHQDRTLWDQGLYATGRQALVEAFSRGTPGVYTLQAALSEVHSRALRASDTAWDEVVALYDRLTFLQPTPVVRLNRAVAVGRSRGPDEALALLADLASEGRLGDYPYFHAAAAEFLDLAGRRADALKEWDLALGLAPTAADRKALEARRGRGS